MYQLQMSGQKHVERTTGCLTLSMASMGRHPQRCPRRKCPQHQVQILPACWAPWLLTAPNPALLPVCCHAAVLALVQLQLLWQRLAQRQQQAASVALAAVLAPEWALKSAQGWALVLALQLAAV